MTSSARLPLRVGIVGAGRLGCALGRALQRAGHEVVAASVRGDAGRARVRELLGIEATLDVRDATRDVDVVVLGVPDAAIAGVVTELAEVEPAEVEPAERSPLVLLPSGSTPLAVLDALARRGSAIARMHPLLSFAADIDPAELRGTIAAVGGSRESVQRAMGIAEEIGLEPFELSEEHAAAWHAAAAIAGNHTVALVAGARDLAVRAGVEERLAMRAMVRLAVAALERAADATPEQALTGPVARGDAGTVSAHLGAIDAFEPRLRPSYQAAAGDALHVARAGGLVGDDAAAAVAHSLGSPR